MLGTSTCAGMAPQTDRRGPAAPQPAPPPSPPPLPPPAPPAALHGHRAAQGVRGQAPGVALQRAVAAGAACAVHAAQGGASGAGGRQRVRHRAAGRAGALAAVDGGDAAAALLSRLGGAHRQLLPAALRDDAVEGGNGGRRLRGVAHAHHRRPAAQPHLSGVPGRGGGQGEGGRREGRGEHLVR